MSILMNNERLTTRGLTRVADDIRAHLGNYWAIRIVPKDADENAFDPACAYVEARLFEIRLRVCDDGEVYIHPANAADETVFMVERGAGMAVPILERFNELVGRYP